MPSKVLIAGAGQLGSRYLQGLSEVSAPLAIYVQDISVQSLQRAEARWLEVVREDSLHEVIFCDDFAGLPGEIDVAIVATGADVRPKVVEGIVRATAIRYWVLEKVLAQSERAIAEIETMASNALGAWVNTPRRIIKWHQQIKSKHCGTTPIELWVTGGMWGLGCNAVHFLDLVQWLTGERLKEVDTRELQPQWFEGKRPGYWEVLGTLVAEFSGGSVARLTVSGDREPYRIQIRESGFEWTIEESVGKAVRSDGLEVPGRLSLQSEITAVLVGDLLDRGNCGLPTLVESADLHRPFVRGMLEHWNKQMNHPVSAVPIT